jgi:hypothetical protein
VSVKFVRDNQGSALFSAGDVLGGCRAQLPQIGSVLYLLSVRPQRPQVRTAAFLVMVPACVEDHPDLPSGADAST